MTGKARTAGLRKKISQRFELSEREHSMLKAVADANEETFVEVFRRMLREEYRFMVREGLIKGALVPPTTKRKS